MLQGLELTHIWLLLRLFVGVWGREITKTQNKNISEEICGGPVPQSKKVEGLRPLCVCVC